MGRIHAPPILQEGQQVLTLTPYIRSHSPWSTHTRSQALVTSCLSRTDNDRNPPLPLPPPSPTQTHRGRIPSPPALVHTV